VTGGHGAILLLSFYSAREIDVLAASGTLDAVLGPMPKGLMASGGEVKVEYQSPLNMAQRASSGIGIMNTLNAIAPLAQMDQSVALLFDPVATARELAEINGVPESVLRSDDQIGALMKQKQMGAAAQQVLAAAPVAASAAKDFAQAQAIAGAAPAQPAPAIV
jgi:hypothetical protein